MVERKRQPLILFSQRIELIGCLLVLLMRLLQLNLRLGHRGLNQMRAHTGKIGRHHAHPRVEFGNFRFTLGVLPSLFFEWDQEFVLVFRIAQGIISSSEIIVMLQQLPDFLVYISRIEHMLAHEIAQPIDVLNHHRLIEHIQRLGRLQPQQGAKPAAIAFKLVVDLCPMAAQALFERPDIGKLAKPRSDIELLIRDDIEFLDPILVPKHLGQRHIASLSLIAEIGEQHGVAILIAQILGLRGVIALPLQLGVGASDIGQFIALAAGSGTGGLVVIALLIRHQQRQQRVDKRRFARAVLTRQQGGVTTRFDAPHPTVKSAPIKHLKPEQTRPATDCVVQSKSPLHESSPIFLARQVRRNVPLLIGYASDHSALLESAY